MLAKELYSILEKDFKLNECGEVDWTEDGLVLNEFVSDNFKNRQMGVLLDNTDKIGRVFTAVFPSATVLKKVLETRNALLFVHHPMSWDIRNAPNIFTGIGIEYLQKLKDSGISVYNLHTPLDRNGKYSTSFSLAKALGIEQKDEFFEYYGVKVGIVGRTALRTPEELQEKVSSVVGHKARLYRYGSDNIEKGLVGVIGGGGNVEQTHKELGEMGINTFITGITLLNDYSRKTHDAAKKNGINIIGATHYSTEKFACMALCDYFKTLGLKCQFIEDKPVMEDM